MQVFHKLLLILRKIDCFLNILLCLDQIALHFVNTSQLREGIRPIWILLDCYFECPLSGVNIITFNLQFALEN